MEAFFISIQHYQDKFDYLLSSHKLLLDFSVTARRYAIVPTLVSDIDGQCNRRVSQNLCLPCTKTESRQPHLRYRYIYSQHSRRSAQKMQILISYKLFVTAFVVIFLISLICSRIQQSWFGSFYYLKLN